MHDFVELVHAVAWPLTILTIVLLMRSEVRSLAAAMAERIRTANTIVVGRRGFEIKGTAEPVVSLLQQRKLRFRRFISAITVKAELDQICEALQIDTVYSLKAEQRSIMDRVAKLVTTNDDMNAMSTVLKNVTGEDF